MASVHSTHGLPRSHRTSFKSASRRTLERKPMAAATRAVLLASLTLLAALTSCVSGNGSADQITESEVKKIENLVGNLMFCTNIPGLSLGVVRGDTTWAAGIGQADWDTGHPASGNTIFHLGSTSKAFVPYILAEIMNSNRNQDGRLRWNMTLRELLNSELDMEVTSPWAEQTLRDALVYSATDTPTSGQSSSASAADMSTMTAGLPEDFTREDLIRRAARFMPDAPGFKSSNHFSNLMYTVAAYLAERITGMSWAELVKDQVMDKQDMKETHFAPAGMSHGDSALPYTYDNVEDAHTQQNRSLFDVHLFEPIGAMMASGDDITKWLRHLLHNLDLKTNASGVNMLIGDAFVHAPSSSPAQQRQQTVLKHQHPEVNLGHGMGWQVSDYRGRRRYQYTGRLYAYSSKIWLFPATQTAVFLASNMHSIFSPGDAATGASRAVFDVSAILDAAMYIISDVVHNDTVWVDEETVCRAAGFLDGYDEDEDAFYGASSEEAMNDESVAPFVGQRPFDYPLPVDAYVGSYGNGLVGDLLVKADQNGYLTLSLGRNLEGLLIPDEEDETQLLLEVMGALENTAEWTERKKVQFLPAPAGGSQLGTVRLHLSEKLWYDFERGKMFETMLAEADEDAVRMQKEEEERRIREEERLIREEEERQREAEEDMKRRKDEAEKKEMMEAVAREKAAEEKRAKEEAERKAIEEEERRKKDEADKKAMMEAVAREKAEEEWKAASTSDTEATSVAAQTTGTAAERKQEAYTMEDFTEGYTSRENYHNRPGNLNRHQNHQPYAEQKEEATQLEQLPPEKSGRRSSQDGRSSAANVADKDGVCSGPAVTPVLLLVAFLLGLLLR